MEDKTENEIECDRCNGTGYLYMRFMGGDYVRYVHEPSMGLKVYCHKCFGSGVVNWIENIFGRRDFS